MWRSITLDDIAATVSQAELEAYRRSAADSGADPVAALLTRTAEMVRGYIRANNSIRLSPNSVFLPDSLISPACDYAAFDILKRFPGKITDARNDARKAAVDLFKSIASGVFTPESFADTGETPQGATTSPVHDNPRRIL